MLFSGRFACCFLCVPSETSSWDDPSGTLGGDRVGGGGS